MNKLIIYTTDLSEQSVRQISVLLKAIEYDVVLLPRDFESKILAPYNVVFYDNLVSEIKHMNSMKSRNAIVFFNIIDIIKFYFINKSNVQIIFRPRGLLPEESFYKNHSYVKKIVLDNIERVALRKTHFLLYLNDNQKKHFNSKYPLTTNKKWAILNNLSYNFSKPCTSCNPKVIKIVYSGGFSKWQNLDETFNLIARLAVYRNLVFTVLTFRKNFVKAYELAKKYNLLNAFSVKYVEPNNLNVELSKHNIGIIVRDDNVINTCASPFKITDYLASGLCIITTQNLRISQIDEKLNQYFHYIVWENGLKYNIDELLDFCDYALHSNISAYTHYKELVSSFERIKFYEGDN